MPIARWRSTSSMRSATICLSIEADYGISVFIVPSDDVKGSQAVIERGGERAVRIRKTAGQRRSRSTPPSKKRKRPKCRGRETERNPAESRLKRKPPADGAERRLRASGAGVAAGGADDAAGRRDDHEQAPASLADVERFPASATSPPLRKPVALRSANGAFRRVARHRMSTRGRSRCTPARSRRGIDRAPSRPARSHGEQGREHDQRQARERTRRPPNGNGSMLQRMSAEPRILPAARASIPVAMAEKATSKPDEVNAAEVAAASRQLLRAPAQPKAGWWSKR